MQATEGIAGPNCNVRVDDLLVESLRELELDDNISNKIQAHLFKKYYDARFGNTTIDFNKTCIKEIIKQHCLINVFAERKILVLYCHNEDDEFGQLICGTWFKTAEVQGLLSVSQFIVTGHNITTVSLRKDLKRYTSSLFDRDIISEESTSSKIYIIIPTKNRMVVHAQIDDTCSLETFRDKLSDGKNQIVEQNSLGSIIQSYPFHKYYGNNIDNCILEARNLRKILVLCCYNDNDTSGEIVCTRWFENTQVQSTLSRSRIIVTGHNITNESNRSQLLRILSENLKNNELLSSIKHGSNKIYLFLPIENKLVAQFYSEDQMSQDEVLTELYNSLITWYDLLKQLEAEQEEDEAEMDENDKKQTDVGFQQIIFDRVGNKDFDVFSKEQHIQLKVKIGFAYFGPPAASSGYNEKQQKFIKKAYDVIMKHSDKYANDDGVVVISFIFACCVNYTAQNLNHEEFFPVPVFVLRKCKSRYSLPPRHIEFCRIVIDSQLRVYSSWFNFLKENKYPKGHLCVPENGEYRCDDKGDVILSYHRTPASGADQTLLRGLDKTSTVAGLGSGGLLLLAAIPAVTIAPIAITAALVAGAGVGVYSIGRSIANLVDRGEHDENLSFSEAESRAAYIGIVAGALGFVGAGTNVVLANLARNGTQIGKATLTSVNALSKANIAAGGLALGNSAYDVTKSYVVDGERPSSLVLVQLGASVLFFSNSVYSYKNASTIVSEAQNNTIQDMKNSLRSNRHRKTFNKMQKETIRVSSGDTAKGNAKVISTIRNANSVDETMAILTRNNNRFNKLGIKISADGGHVSFNGKTMRIDKFAVAVNKVEISEVMSLPPEEIASSSWVKTLNVNWIELGRDAVGAGLRVYESRTIGTVGVELLDLFTPFVQSKIMAFMDKLLEMNVPRKPSFESDNIIHYIIQFICDAVRTKLNLGTFAQRCISMIKFLVNHYFCTMYISEAVMQECLDYVTRAMCHEIKTEEETEMETNILQERRSLVRCSTCRGYYSSTK